MPYDEYASQQQQQNPHIPILLKNVQFKPSCTSCSESLQNGCTIQVHWLLDTLSQQSLLKDME